MNSLLAAEGRKLNSGAGGLGGGISKRVFSSCFRKASLAAAWRLAGESFTLVTDMLLPEEAPFKPDAEAYGKKGRKKQDSCKYSVMITRLLAGAKPLGWMCSVAKNIPIMVLVYIVKQHNRFLQQTVIHFRFNFDKLLTFTVLAKHL